jgi:hypothetical protein
MIWLERARARGVRNPVEDKAVSLVAGVDVGGGAAETVAYVCACKPQESKIISLGAWRGEDTRGQVVRFLEPYRTCLSTVRVDAVGIGHNFGLHLRDHRYPIELVNVGLPCPSQPELGENNPATRFVNEKARFYQNLADALEGDQIEGLTDDETIGQLANLQYEIDAHGRMKIEPKEKARQRGVPSPDRAEALMLALGQPRPLIEFFSVRDLPRRQSNAVVSHFPPWQSGFVERPRQHDDDRPALRKSRRWGPGAW